MNLGTTPIDDDFSTFPQDTTSDLQNLEIFSEFISNRNIQNRGLTWLEEDTEVAHEHENALLPEEMDEVIREVFDIASHLSDEQLETLKQQLSSLVNQSSSFEEAQPFIDLLLNEYDIKKRSYFYNIARKEFSEKKVEPIVVLLI